MVEDFNEYTRKQKYWRWSPGGLCRPHFRTSELRVELDTSAETGINDWNYIDSISCEGSTEMQGAALPTGTSTVVYVPDHNAHGWDGFEYRGSDCPGE